jgi:hypothetical protein
MFLSELLRRKDEILSIAKKFGLQNIRITRNIGAKLNLVIDEDPSRSDLPKIREMLFVDYLSSILKCEIELFMGTEMGTKVVNLDKSQDEIIKDVSQLFQKSPKDIYINEKHKDFGLSPPRLASIKQIMGDEMITPRSTSSEGSATSSSPRNDF